MQLAYKADSKIISLIYQKDPIHRLQILYTSNAPCIYIKMIIELYRKQIYDTLHMIKNYSHKKRPTLDKFCSCFNK